MRTLSLVQQLARDQVQLYRAHPAEMRPAYVHERSVEKSYRGRQLLELLQNADDAGREHVGASRLLLRLTGDSLVVANTGSPFTPEGIASLVISDRSPKQLSSGSYIGQKGLGFRSLLSWSESPYVWSGSASIAFAPEHARRVAEEIALEVPALKEDLDRYAEQHGSLPVPVMRFPYEPDSDDPRRRLAAAVREEGYDTVIVLPILGGARGELVRAEITRQAEEIRASTLLFSNYLTEIRVEVGELVESWSVDRQANEGSHTVALQRGDELSLWTLHRRDLVLPAELLGTDERMVHVGLAVAVPETIDVATGNTLCVFFPTSVSLPTALLAHATLETDDSRKRLIEGPATVFALKSLADFFAEVAEVEANSSDDAWRGLELLAGAENCDPELDHLGFRAAVLDAIRSRRLFPRIDGLLATASECVLPPFPTWRDLATSDWLGDLLAEPSSEEVDVLLSALVLTALPATDQVARLEARIAEQLDRGHRSNAGRLVGTLLEAGALPKSPLAGILIDETGKLRAPTDPILLPSEGATPQPPHWASDIHFLHAEFSEGLRSVAKVTGRELSRRLTALGYTVDEYQLETVARRLIRTAELLDAVSPSGAEERTRDVLQCAFAMARSQTSASPIDVPFRVLTEGGRVRRASECYTGRAYQSGALLTALYEPLGQDEFCAAPHDLGLDAPVTEVELFLSRIGVSNRVRRYRLDSTWAIRQAGLVDHVRETLARLTYPQELAEHVFLTADEAFRELEIYYHGVDVPDRWHDVLLHGSAEAIVAYTVAERLKSLDPRPVLAITLRARHGHQYNFRDCRSVPVTDPTLFLLREVAWVPCDDGSRHQPRRVALSRRVQRALGTAVKSHTIDQQNTLLTGVGGATAVNMVLQAAGAVQSLDALRGDDLYALLLELPERDPDGLVAPSVYRSLVEGTQLDVVSPRREEFLRRGLMWGTKGDDSGYFPVAELRYAPRTAVPDPIREHVPLVEIDPRRASGEIERVFGVRPLAADEYEIVIDEEATELAGWSQKAAHHLRACVSHCYALRNSQRADDRGEEKRAFAALDLAVARRLVAQVKLEGRESKPAVIDGDLKGLSSAYRLYLVSKDLNFSLDPVFWRAVADLVADAINVPRAGGDFGSLLACAEESQRNRLLDHMTGGRGKVLLAEARVALDVEDAEPEESAPLPAPQPSEPPYHDPAEPPPIVTVADVTPVLPRPPAIPTPIVAPTSRATGPRDLVVTGPAGDGGGPSSSPGEDVTLQIAEQFERLDVVPRFPIRVSHLRGIDAFGCDIISLDSPEARDRALREQTVNLTDIVRFIEVKGRTARSGPVSLSENERRSAERHGSRYYIYRVYTDTSRPDYHELAIMSDPTSSPGENVQTSWSYSFAEGSGAQWFRMPGDVSGAPEEVSPPVSEASVE